MSDRTTERISWIEGDTYFEREVDSVAVARIEHEAVAAERRRILALVERAHQRAKTQVVADAIALLKTAIEQPE